MNIILTIILLQLLPDGVVLKITKVANVPSMEYCLEAQRQVGDLYDKDPEDFIKLVSISCKETGSI